MLRGSRIVKDGFYSRQFLRQYTLELTFSALTFTDKYARMSKIIKYKVIWSQMQIFISSNTDNACKIVQAWGNFAPSIFSFVHSFRAA